MAVMAEPGPESEPEYALHEGACGQMLMRRAGDEQWRHVTIADAGFCAMLFPHLYESPEQP